MSSKIGAFVAVHTIRIVNFESVPKDLITYWLWWLNVISAFIFIFRFILDSHSNFEFRRFLCHVIWNGCSFGWFVSTKYFCQALKNWLWKIILKPWSHFQLQISQIKVFSSSLKVRKIQENLISHASEVSIFMNNKENGKISILHRTNVIITSL